MKQQKLFEAETRIKRMIRRLENEPEIGNKVKVQIPKIADLCRDLVPQCFE